MEASKCLNTWSAVMSELNQGRELAKQLQNHLDPSTPHETETRQYLIQKILLTYSKLLHMTNLPCNNNSFAMDPNSSQINFQGGATSESPRSVSPCSGLESPRRASKRRKTLPKWVKTVKVSAEEGGVERSLNDGYSWRKYGQKAILGATFPRGYYRCTHRHTRGCYATKQVQKSTEDPTVCQIIYKGHHTCNSQPIHVHVHVSQPSTSRNPPPAPGRGPLHPLKPEAEPEPAQPKPRQETHVQNHRTPGFAQPQLKVEMIQQYSEVLDIDNIFSAFLGTTTGFVSGSPTTSDSNHLRGGGNGVWTPESDVNYEQQGGSGPESPFGRLEFTLEELDELDELNIDPNFTFDDLELFQ